jgi:phosphoribosylformylglycinamidine (FGAM) synthase PurS component
VLDPTGIAISTAADDQESPAAAFDGTDFLVVWRDGRNPGNPDIYGARVSPTGAVLDPSGIAISTAANDQGGAAVGFDGVNFLVVWHVYRSGYWDIYGARLTPQGTVLDPEGIAISTAANDQGGPAVGFDGANFLVAWTDARSGFDYDIYGARVTPQGTVLDPSGIAISTAAGYQWFFLAVAFDDADLLVVWTDRRSMDHYDIYGARVTPQGTVLDPEGIAISIAVGDQAYPAVAFDGTNSLVVWEDWRSGDTSDIYGARVSPAGVVFDSGPVVRQEGSQYCPLLARGTGSQLFLVYQGWAGTVGGTTYNADRIWGKVNPNPGIEETMNDERGTLNIGPSIVRGVLVLGAVDSRQNTAYRADLLDISGRKVAELHPGPNDVRALAPGVYFARQVSDVELGASNVTKVVVAR